jgi:hypothetical protein
VIRFREASTLVFYLGLKKAHAMPTKMDEETADGLTHLPHYHRVGYHERDNPASASL